MHESPSRLSVIVPTRQGWPAIEPAIRALVDQVAQVGGDLIVADGSGRPAPDMPGHVRWISEPADLSVFQLRQRAYERATAEIIATTEDHCRVTPGWCQRILELHAAHPEAVAIGGSVANGTTRWRTDWAAFLLTQVPFTAPLGSGPSDRVTGPANLSLKRRVLGRLPRNNGFGTIELFDQAAMKRDGDIFWLESDLVVLHDQSLGIAGTSTIEFHNGRAIGGFRRRSMARGDWARIAGSPLVLAYRIARTLRMAWAKDVPRSEVVLAAPAIAWLQICNSAGELLGYATGPGDSAQRLR
jgi:hypothetical protein